MFSKGKTSFLLERNIRQQLFLLSETFEPQIKQLLKKLEVIPKIIVNFEDEYMNEYSSKFSCSFCNRKFDNTMLLVYHLLFIHRNMKFLFKLEPSNPIKNIYNLNIRAEKKPFTVINPSAFFFRYKPNSSNKGIRYEVKLTMQKIMKKSYFLFTNIKQLILCINL